jgi:hypothetical protein
MNEHLPGVLTLFADLEDLAVIRSSRKIYSEEIGAEKKIPPKSLEPQLTAVDDRIANRCISVYDTSCHVSPAYGNNLVLQCPCSFGGHFCS